MFSIIFLSHKFWKLKCNRKTFTCVFLIITRIKVRRSDDVSSTACTKNVTEIRTMY